MVGNLESQLTRLTDAVLKPLNGREPGDITPALSTRISALIRCVLSLVFQQICENVRHPSRENISDIMRI